MRLLSSWMCRAHCHRLIKLSGTIQPLAPEKELVENVHGVRRTFLDVGRELQTNLTSTDKDTHPIFSPDASPTVYFIGKMLWSKGLDSLMELVKYAEESAGLKVKIDMYGGGPNKDEASAKAEKMGLDMPFHGPIDHAELGWTHKVSIVFLFCITCFLLSAFLIYSWHHNCIRCSSTHQHQRVSSCDFYTLGDSIIYC